jgi:Zn-dependent protease
MDYIELRDILVSWLVLSLAFTILFRVFSIESFLMFLFIIGFSIITHEFAHRQVAKRLRFDAKYKVWPFGLLLALLSSFAGFLFAAPGVVYISPRFVFHESRERLREANFKISAAGPGTNLILGLIFIILLSQFELQLFYFAAYINIWLAIFNLIPFPSLDGSKIFSYNTKYWGIMMISAIILFIFL